MVQKQTKRLVQANEELRISLDNLGKNLIPEPISWLALTKAFEILVEYGWRFLKKAVEDQGLEAQSPKIAVKQAGKVGLIDNPDKWLECIDLRNNSVHGYYTVSREHLAELAKDLLELTEKLCE